MRRKDAVAPGQVIDGRYEVLRPLGRGGMATAVLVRDRLWEVEVALKLLGAPTAELLEAFRFEFAALRALSHPRLTRVHDFSALARGPGGAPLCFYTADVVDGATLGERGRGARWGEVVAPLLDALDALRALHAAGLRHGDVKPDNVLVGPDGRGVLIDLGCARPLAAARHDASVSGTPGFLAPELLQGGPVDHRADLFAVGATLAQLLDGLAGPAPAGVAALADRLRRPRPADRPADVDEVLVQLGAEPALIHPVASRLGRLAGRAAELGAAHAALEALLAAEPGPRALHLAGPEGVGRSRVLRELKWTAQPRCRVLEANPAAPDAVQRLLAETLGLASPPGRPVGLVELADRLRASPPREPVVWVVDDVHRLAESQLELLAACLRLLEPDGQVLAVVSSLPGLALDGAALRRIELVPLVSSELEAWLGGVLAPRTLEHLGRLSGGSPAALQALLRPLIAGAATEEDLCRSTVELAPGGRRAAAVAELSGDEPRALALLAVVGAPVVPGDLPRFGLAPAAFDGLVARGLAERDGAGWKLVRAGETDPLLAALDGGLVRGLHAEVARWAAAQLEAEASTGGRGPRAAELAAREVLHLALAGEVERATRGLLDRRALAAMAPLAWWRAGDALGSRSADPALQLEVARLERAAGRPQQALERLERLLDAGSPPPAALAAAARVELGACRFRLGEAAKAVAELELARAAGAGPELEAQAANLLARALTALGDHGRALKCAEEGLRAGGLEPGLEVDLLEAAGVAASFAGDPRGAQDRLDRAAALLATFDDPRRQVRALGSRALVAYARGELNAAGEDHRRALELAEARGLSDQVATAALNLGTVSHGRGALAEALESYERGLRMAVALGQRSTAARLRFNLAKLSADLGLGDRALVMADACEACATAAGLPLVAAAADTVRAEVAAARGEPARARAWLERARGAIEAHGSARDRAELLLQLAELDAAEGALDRAGAGLERCAELLRGLDAGDVELRLSLGKARVLHAHGLGHDALPLVERAAIEARRIGQADLEAEAEAEAARLCRAQGAAALAERHRGRALELWERAAAPLPPAIREAFWAHPRRAGVGDAPPPLGPGEPTRSPRERRLVLLLDLNRRLNSSLTTPRVLSRAMDAAIELTGAERGFVLLADERPGRGAAGPLRVAVARNFDREEIGRSRLKFSRGIAEQVVATGEPLITADAQADGRLSTKASVHAMQLKSVLCVPVGSPGGILGALYLDNRFRHGLFTAEDVELLQALADQVALALTNARLHDELRERNRQLEAEQRRVEELLRGQAEEIARLTSEIEQRRGARREHRFDYSEIIGSSRAMERVFAVLDRVIDTDLAVLVTGESGTGKELVARAIHRNNPATRAGRLVSINCGALPETLLESELFGSERGAFTGADRAREGLVVQARGGTLFLDEVGEMPPPMQVKLLRVLQEHVVQPLGASAPVPVDFRLVCATNRDLKAEVAARRFREDLYYRISTVELAVPPLRERPEDLPELIGHILARVAEQTRRPAPEITRQGLRKLTDHDWPGNVRQLENVLTKAAVFAEQGRVTARDLELGLPGRDPPAAPPRLSREAFRAAEDGRIAEALAANRWNVSKVARLLGIPRPTLYRRIRLAGLAKGPDR